MKNLTEGDSIFFFPVQLQSPVKATFDHFPVFLLALWIYHAHFLPPFFTLLTPIFFTGIFLVFFARVKKRQILLFITGRFYFHGDKFDIFLDG